MDEEVLAKLTAYEEEISGWDKDHLLAEKLVAENRLGQLSALGYESIEDNWAPQEKVKVAEKNLGISEQKVNWAMYSLAISNALESQHIKDKLFTRTQAYLITSSTVVLAGCAVAAFIVQLLEYLKL